jgi:transketolase
LVEDDVLAFFRQAVKRGESLERQWRSRLDAYCRDFPELAGELERRLNGQLPAEWENDLPVFAPDPKGMATRAASGKVINALAPRMPELIGGSADLTPSNKTWINGSPSFQKTSFQGRNFHFGVREHAMGGIVNGMAVHGGIMPYGGTFLVFSDYMRPAIRLSALSHYPSIWVFTHDSIGVGEDGPTHQPVEHLAALRAIPGLFVIRPGDANEVSEAWRLAILRRDGPTALLLTRQDLPVLDRDVFASAQGLRRGAYVLADVGEGEPRIILMASGSEVSLIVEAGVRLAADAICVRLVSFPCWELFARQDPDYRDTVLPAHIPLRLAVEAGVTLGWERWTGDHGKIIGVDRFGASAPYKTIYNKFGLTAGQIVETTQKMLAGAP